MKKSICIVIFSTILISSILYAAKPLDIDTPTLKGFIKTKDSKEFVETNGWIIFKGLDAKSQIQITEANGANILVNDAKMIKQKGKVSGNINNIIIGTSESDMADCSDLVLAGNEKFSVKLKGINIGSVVAKDMKMVLINDLSGCLTGTNPKGIKIMTQDGGIEGTEANPVIIGAYWCNNNLIEVPTKIKMVKAKKGAIGYVNACNATPAKIGKTKWGAKVQSSGSVCVRRLSDWMTPSKMKNPNFFVECCTNIYLP